MPTSSSVFQFKISLDYIEPLIWRRIQVPADYNFNKLHFAILNAMGWDGSHLYEFACADDLGNLLRIGSTIEAEEDVLSDAEVKLSKIFSKDKKIIKYTYDFGDDWLHTIEFEGAMEAEKKKKYPVCLDGKNACPLEDIGGPPGYEYFLKVMSDSKHKDYDSFLEIYGDDFNPKYFNPKKVLFAKV